MTIVVVGAKERNTPEDEKQVGELIEQLAVEYANPLLVTLLTHTGVGRFVKSKCLERRADGNFRFQLIACDFRLYAVNLSQPELAQIYIARNASPFELGDAFCYFASLSRRGTMENMIARAQEQGRPFRVFLPGQPITAPTFG
jgi:hypothetical protein